MPHAVNFAGIRQGQFIETIGNSVQKHTSVRFTCSAMEVMKDARILPEVAFVERENLQLIVWNGMRDDDNGGPLHFYSVIAIGMS